jgi:CRP/FNR family transcriptional regulator, polysaccharide utilization system transcription regulator
MTDFITKSACPKDCNCLLKQILNDEDFAKLVAGKSIVNFYKGETIFKQNAFTSHIAFILDGYTKTYLEGTKGKQQILYLSSKGDILGQLSLFFGDASILSISALTDCSVCLISVESLKYFLTMNPNLATLIIGNINKHNYLILQRILSLTQKQMHGRVADTLLYLSSFVNNKDVIDIPLSRKEFAELSGMTTESFIRILTEYKNDGIISIDGKFIEIKSFNLLKKLSEIG